MLFSYPLLLDEQNNVLLAEFIVNFFLFLVLEPGLAWWGGTETFGSFGMCGWEVEFGGSEGSLALGIAS